MRKDAVRRSILRSMGWGCAVLILVVLPLLEGWGLLRSQNASFTDLFPLWSDEIYYWHQAATFARADLRGGFYTVGEVQPAARFSRYYAWGLIIPAFYGLIGRFFGWPLWAMPLINLVLLSLSLGLWVILVRPRVRHMLAMMLLLATFAPFLCAIPSSMIEVLQCAWAVALGGALTGLWLAHTDADRMIWGLVALFIAALAANFRITWGMLLPFIGALWLRHRGMRGITGGAALGLALAAGLYLFTDRTAAPYSQFASHLSAFKISFQAGVEASWAHIQTTLEALRKGEPIEIGLRLQVVGVWLMLCVAALMRWAVPRLRALIIPFDVWEIALHTLLLPGLLALTILMYDVGSWRDYRVFGPHVLLSGVLLIGRRRWGCVALLIFSSCLLLPSAVPTAQQWTQDYLQQRDKLTKLAEWNRQVDEWVRYDPKRLRGWCNTLTHTVYFAFGPTYLLLAADPGIGLSMLLSDDDVHLPFRARYLMLDNDFIKRYEGKLHVDTLMPVPGGNLYLNRDARCPRHRGHP